MLLFVAFAVASCAEEEIIENKVVGKPGEEVKFSLSLNKKSRTVYGDEINNTFPIYWVDGDKVQVYSPQASSSRNNAEYKVILPKGENGVVVEKPDYAGDLEKTGDYGVQWGVGDKYTDDNDVTHTGVHDFYSIYPSGNYKFSEDDKENMIASRLRVKTVQEISYVDGTYTHDMSNCLMYATTPKVDMEDGVVNLSYHPLSTVLWFDVTAFKDNTLQDAQQTNFMITGIELEYTGTEGAIAGAFNYDVTNGKFIDFEEPYNKISVRLYDKSGTQELSHTVKAGEPLNFPIFLAPSDLDLNNLKITIHTDNGTFTKTLSGASNFKPGKIHKITLPELSKTSKGWDVSKWMTYIPRNVYLSEISIPGSWDSINGDKQGETSIETQYGYGVRAFHFDTRWRSSDKSSLFGYIDNDINALSVCGAASSAKLSGVSGNNRAVLGGAETFEQKLDKIVACLADDEYMVLICTFAQDSYDYTGTNGKWYAEISAICSKEKYDDTLVDAKTITANTVVGDVLGRLLVIVNMPETISATTSLPDDSRCLFTYLPTMLSKSHFDGTDDNQDKFWVSYKVDDTLKAKETGIIVYNTQAQATANGNTAYETGSNNRGYAPTISQRITVGNKILDWSKNNYNSEDYEHNMWVYLGLGGYYVKNTSADEVSNSASSVAEQLNPWISSKVNEMGTIPTGQTEKIPYYPVGIVLMNYVNTSTSQTTVKDILLLNNKYRLQYDSKKPVDYDPLYWTPGTGDGEGGEGGDGI